MRFIIFLIISSFAISYAKNYEGEFEIKFLNFQKTSYFYNSLDLTDSNLENFKLKAPELYEASDYIIPPEDPYERKGFAFDPSEANREKFQRTIKAMRFIKEHGGDEALRMGGVLNALVAINKKYDYIDPYEAYREFFGGDIPLEQAESELEDIYNLTEDYANDYEFSKIAYLLPCERNKIISEHKKVIEHKKKIDKYKSISKIILFSFLILLIIIGALYILKKFLNLSKGTPISRLYAILSIFLLIASFARPGDLFDGYYTLLRLITSGVCLYSAVKFKTEWTKWIFGGMAVLYNPILPIHLGDKGIWSIINIATVIYMWIALKIEKKAK